MIRSRVIERSESRLAVPLQADERTRVLIARLMPGARAYGRRLQCGMLCLVSTRGDSTMSMLIEVWKTEPTPGVITRAQLRHGDEASPRLDRRARLLIIWAAVALSYMLARHRSDTCCA